MKMVNSVFNRERYSYCKWWNIFAHIRRLLTMIKAIYQRAKYGFEPYDTYCLDNYLGNHISNLLIYLNENRHGYPSDMSDESWGEYLEEMAEAFRFATVEDTERLETLREQWVEMLTEYGREDKVTQAAWEILQEEEKKHFKLREEAINKACDMLKARFFNLWD